MAKTPIVLGYFLDRDPVPPSLAGFTHIAHAFAFLAPDGAVRRPPADHSAALRRAATSADAKLVLSVGGADSGRAFAAAVSTPERRAAFADTLVAAVRAGGYDGLDIDWEFPESAAEGGQLTDLVKGLRERLPRGLLMSAVPALEWGGKQFEVPALRLLLDYLQPMTYDYSGPWEKTSGHHADFVTTDRSLDYWLGRGWPKERLLLGLPLYARGFKASRWGETVSGQSAHAELTYAEATRLNWPQRRDPAAKADYLEKPGGGELISLDTPRTIAAKVRRAQARGLGGYFFWEITQDTIGGKRVLVDAARAAWK